MNVIQEMVKNYRTPSGRINPWFTRKLQQQSEPVQSAIREELQRIGEMVSGEITDKEWDWLASAISLEPERLATKTCIQVVNELCADRRPPLKHRINAKTIKPLFDRLRRMRSNLDLYCRMVATPTPEMLSRLNDREVLEHFGPRVLHLVLKVTLQQQDR